MKGNKLKNLQEFEVVTTLRWYDVTVPRIQSPTSFSLPTLFLKIDVDVKNVSGM